MLPGKAKPRFVQKNCLKRQHRKLLMTVWYLDSLDNEYDMPSCVVPTLLPLLEQYKSLFRTSPGSTTVAEHFISTTDASVKVTPRKIPANYRLGVEKQIQIMLNEGIIEECSSPWLAPAVIVCKKTEFVS